MLEGMVADVRGNKILYSSEEDSNTTPGELGMKLAQKLLNMGAKVLIDESREKG
jgi:porphobilinogen deaminase